MSAVIITQPSIIRTLADLRCYGRRGVVALEFAIMAPLLMVPLMFMYDAANGWMVWHRLTVAARSVAQISTLLAVNADGSNTLSHDQAWRASTAIYAAMPETLAAGAIYGVVMSEVLFSSPDSCNGVTCVANVAWSTTLLGSATRRACGAPLSAVPDSFPPSPGVLPQSAFQSAPVLVVDITYSFKPTLLGSLIGGIPMAWSAYLPVRSGTSDQTISYEDSSAQCPPPRGESPKPPKSNG